MNLVIVESPAKAKTINRFLGKEYLVKASLGHLIDLPKSQLGIDINQDFQVKYITIRGKGKILAELRKLANKADKVYLATDPDREGEAIAWHLAREFKLPPEQIGRVAFNEVTRAAVKRAFKEPRGLNQNLIDSQQARRVLDRLVGYKISPILWSKVKRGLSAGRVQSAALNMICRRQQEIEDFVPREYWSVEVDFALAGNGTVRAKLARLGGSKPELTDEEGTRAVVAQIESGVYQVAKLEASPRLKNPRPPFTTSTLQQQAGTKLGFAAKKTMVVAQQLYEGISLGRRGTTGLITYMRTDSVRIAPEFVEKAREYVAKEYGAEYVPETPRQYAPGKGAQQAHEAIRPTDLTLRPAEIRSFLSPDQYKLYTLIWQRFIQSQMAAARYRQQTIDIAGADMLFKASFMELEFPGYLAVTGPGAGSDQEVDLSRLKEGNSAQVVKVHPQQHCTQPPPGYSEALLVKDMERRGIGRPSTYAPTIETLLQRGYVERKQGKLVPTQLGKLVDEELQKFFPAVLSLDFTANMERRLDEIEEGRREWKQVLREFYGEFSQLVARAAREMAEHEIQDQPSDQLCPQCGRNLVIKQGRFGKFLACPGYPECKHTQPFYHKIGIKCPHCQGDVVIRKSKRGRLFYGCSNYPQCDFRSWKRPLAEGCPECGAHLVVQSKKTVGCSQCPYREQRENEGD